MANWKLVANKLGKFTKQQLTKTVLHLDMFNNSLEHFVNEEEADSVPKDVLIDEFIRCLKRSRTKSKTAVGNLTLLFVYLHASARSWSMYRFKKVTFDLENDRGQSPQEISTRLQELLSSQSTELSRTSVVTQIHDGYCWILISYQTKRRTATFAHSFVVYSQGSHFMCCSGFANKKANEQLFKYLGLTLGFRGAELTNLKDRNIGAMFRLVATAYEPRLPRLNIHPTSTLRDIVDIQEEHKELPCEDFSENLKDANLVEKTERKQQATELYGVEPPELSSIIVSVETAFRGRKSVPNMDNDFQFSVTLKGSGVLEGMQQMVDNGIMQWPLPESLSEIPITARNTFNVT